MDRLTAMRSFVEVAHCKSFTKASERLNLSRLQVSRHVNEVEAWLEQRLLHRTTRKVSLTTAGEAALIQCEKILHETLALEVASKHHTPSLSGTIRIAAPIGLTQNMLIEAVEAFTDRHAGVNVQLFASDHFAQLVDERIDIALRYTEQPADNLIARRLMNIDSVICASTEYLNQFGEPKEISELEKHNCFLHLEKTHWEFIEGNSRRTVAVSGSIKANDLGVLVKAAQHGKGIVLLPCDLANPLISQGSLTTILNNCEIPSSTLWAVYLSRSYQLPVVRQFIDFLAERWSKDINSLN